MCGRCAGGRIICLKIILFANVSSEIAISESVGDVCGRSVGDVPVILGVQQIIRQIIRQIILIIQLMQILGNAGFPDMNYLIFFTSKVEQQAHLNRHAVNCCGRTGFSQT